jgi:uncharacterized phosphosugar-binding protein
MEFSMTGSKAAGRWTTAAIGRLERLAERIAQAAEWCADAIAAGGLVHLVGTGHSRIAVEHSRASQPGHHSGRRLLDVADLVIDLGTPVGDALITLDGLDTPVGPSSSVVAVAVVNEIKVQTAELLMERGMIPPVITASAVVGPERSSTRPTASMPDGPRRRSPVRNRRPARASSQGGNPSRGAEGTGFDRGHEAVRTA